MIKTLKIKSDNFTSLFDLNIFFNLRYSFCICLRHYNCLHYKEAASKTVAAMNGIRKLLMKWDEGLRERYFPFY